IATSIGHSPLTALIDPVAGSRNSIGEALSNLVFAPLKGGLKSVSLSANWMWPCKNKGEDARLYEAVKGCSDFAIELGINIPTGKDSLSMKQKYPDGEVIAPGTVIISTVGNCTDITQVAEPVLKKNGGNIYYINLSQDDFKLGGTSFAQILNKIGNEAATVKNAGFFKKAFNLIQDLIKQGKIQAGHDVGSGGLITSVLEMCIAENNLGADIVLPGAKQDGAWSYSDLVKILFNENIGIVFQAQKEVESILESSQIEYFYIGKVTESNTLSISHNGEKLNLDI